MIPFSFLTLLLSLTACANFSSSPRSVVQNFVAALSNFSFQTAANYSDNKEKALNDLKKSFDGVDPTSFSGHVGKADIKDDFAEVTTKYSWKIADQEWDYELKIPLLKQNNKWIIKWLSSNIYPQLGDTQVLKRIPVESSYSPIVDAGGRELMIPGDWNEIFFHPNEFKTVSERIYNLQKIFFILKPFLQGKSVPQLSEEATATKNRYFLAKLNSDDYKKYKNALLDVSGITVEKIADLFPVDTQLDLTYLNRIKNNFINDLKGKNGWQIAMVSEFGRPIQALKEVAAVPAGVMRLSLSYPIQTAAQQAVDTRQNKAAMMVVIQPSTGKILAIAHNALAQQQGLLAASGMYPPGSTFKIVTAAAGINSKTVNANSTVPCPGTIEIGPRVIPNYGSFSLGNVSLQSAFANSCNTTFAKLSSEMPNQLLNNTARILGLGKDYNLSGITTNTGDVPIVSNIVEKAENGFGQGSVLVSVFGMALVAANVDLQREVAPKFMLNEVENDKLIGKDKLQNFTYANLKSMMRAVVTSGTAIAINSIPDLYGKTGEAEFNGGSHAWFVGYKDDLAFASLIVNGGGSETAVAMTKTFFENMG